MTKRNTVSRINRRFRLQQLENRRACLEALLFEIHEEIAKLERQMLERGEIDTAEREAV